MKKRLQTILWHHNARVNSHQRWKQTRFRVCFHLWCELTSTMNVTEWQVSRNSCLVSHCHVTSCLGRDIWCILGSLVFEWLDEFSQCYSHWPTWISDKIHGPCLWLMVCGRGLIPLPSRLCTPSYPPIPGKGGNHAPFWVGWPKTNAAKCLIGGIWC